MRRLLNKYKLGFAALLVLGMGAGLFYGQSEPCGVRAGA